MYRVYLLYSNWLWELIRGLISAIELLWRPLYWIEQDHKRSTFLTFLPWLSLGSMLRELSWEQKESLTRCTAAGRTRAKNTLDGQEVESTTHSSNQPAHSRPSQGASQQIWQVRPGTRGSVSGWCARAESSVEADWLLAGASLPLARAAQLCEPVSRQVLCTALVQVLCELVRQARGGALQDTRTQTVHTSLSHHLCATI